MWKKSRIETGEETGRKLLGDKWDLIIEALSAQNQDITKYIVEWKFRKFTIVLNWALKLEKLLH